MSNARRCFDQGVVPFTPFPENDNSEDNIMSNHTHSSQQHTSSTRPEDQPTGTPTCKTLDTQCGKRQRHQQHQQQQGRPASYLIITNISKRANIRSLLLTAAAFRCMKVFVVGQRKFDFDPGGSDIPKQIRRCCVLTQCDGEDGDGEDARMKIIRFEKLEECVSYIHSIDAVCDDKNDNCIVEKEEEEEGVIMEGGECHDEPKRGPVRILGVEIDESAVDLEDEPFEGDTAFMMGNEGQGMSSKQMSVCDGFIRIAQYGGGTASLNVSVAASIVLHRFYSWAKDKKTVV